MRKYGLGYISDSDLYNHTKETAKKYRFKINLKSFNKNLIDPIKLTFDSKIYKKNIQEIIQDEIIRQIDKSNNNQIGYFHQNIFKYINADWDVPESGFDLINKKDHIFVEMKNKHNTTNSSSGPKLYMKMQNKLLNDDEATCMLVEVIARKTQDRNWVISVDGTRYNNKRIRRVSIDKFYELVTNDPNAFRSLCEKLPLVLDDIIEDTDERVVDNTVFSELKEINPELLKSLYLLAFGKYEGFDKFDI